MSDIFCFLQCIVCNFNLSVSESVAWTWSALRARASSRGSEEPWKAAMWGRCGLAAGNLFLQSFITILGNQLMTFAGCATRRLTAVNKHDSNLTIFEAGSGPQPCRVWEKPMFITEEGWVERKNDNWFSVYCDSHSSSTDGPTQALYRKLNLMEFWKQMALESRPAPHSLTTSSTMGWAGTIPSVTTGVTSSVKISLSVTSTLSGSRTQEWPSPKFWPCYCHPLVSPKRALITIFLWHCDYMEKIVTI